jgi:predicted NUDIX family NTP pyrophosphohydrolase
MEWPPHSGIVIDVPEVDRVAWFDPEAARAAMNPAQAGLLDLLLEALKAEP